MHRWILVACAVTTVPFVAWLLTVGSGGAVAANLTLLGVLFLVVAYTVLGAHATVVASTLAYALAAAVLLAVPWPGWLAALLPLPYAVNAAAFWSVRDEDCERANRGWRRFLWLNLVTGFLVTMLLIAVART